jgi:hypothetical protein
MRQESVPARVDRSYLHTASGSARAQLTGTFRALGLIDAELGPTETLRELVQDPERRPEILSQIVETFYAPIVALDDHATQQQLEEAFRDEYGIQGSTVRKAASFYLAIAKAAGIKTSSLFATTRTSTAGATRRRRTPKTVAPIAPVAPTRDLPEIIGALIAKLPKKGETWTAREFNWWLDMVKLAGPREYGFDLPPKGE